MKAKPHPAVFVLAALAFAAERRRGARLEAEDLQSLYASSLGETMRACAEYGRSTVSEGLEPPDLARTQAQDQP